MARRPGGGAGTAWGEKRHPSTHHVSCPLKARETMHNGAAARPLTPMSPLCHLLHLPDQSVQPFGILVSPSQGFPTQKLDLFSSKKEKKKSCTSKNSPPGSAPGCFHGNPLLPRSSGERGSQPWWGYPVASQPQLAIEGFDETPKWGVGVGGMADTQGLPLAPSLYDLR